MRLINTKTLVLHEFFEGDIPPYGILSHTWGPEEVTFQDWLYVTKQNPARWGWVYIDEEIDKIKTMTGYVKITAVCWQATQDALDWMWVDTNCIDKTNSAELSEAINSMFRWYQRASKCYVLLADVSSTSVEDCHKVDSDFRTSRWFTRGWTLQELPAPPDLVFFSNQWIPICRRDEIATTINDITKIPEPVLVPGPEIGRWYPIRAMEDKIPIAEIMSWASNRKTTRIEDEAYCLLGLFDINMPLLYGEGPNAFRRLQLEIIQRTTDLSFLAWQEPPSSESTDDTLFKPLRTALASKPYFFKGGSDTRFDPDSGKKNNLRISNRGLSLRLPLIETLDPAVSFAVLSPNSRRGRAVWMPLRRVGSPYYRIGLISTTMMVTPCPVKLKKKDVVLPIFVDSSPMYLDLTNLRHSSKTSILLTFPVGLKKYRVLDRVTVAFDPQDDTFKSDGLLLYLRNSENDPSVVYGAIEFELDWISPRPGRKGERMAMLFIARRDEMSRPMNWTCVDISLGHRRADKMKHSLEARAKVAVNESIRSAAPRWKQECSFEDADGQEGLVIMDDPQRDLSAADLGGYRKDPGSADHLGASPSNHGYWPILAQIVFDTDELDYFRPRLSYNRVALNDGITLRRWTYARA